MLDFIAPALSPSTVSLYQKLWKVQAFLRRGRTKLLISPEVQRFLFQLREQRVIICPNHPMEEDGPILFALSAAMKEKFHFLAAREIFGHSSSKHARLLQKLGCYSVQRGLADVHAFKYSCQLLKAGPCKLVIFPEGEVSYRSNFMREFESGPELIALSVLDDLRRSGCDEKVFILPIALKYEFSRDQTPYLTKLMCRVEKALKVDNSNAAFYQRLQMAYELALEKLEHEFSIHPKAALLEDRLFEICNERIAQWERNLKLTLPQNQNQVRKIHLLMNGIAAKLYGRSDGKPPEGERQFLKKGYLQLKQCISLMAVREGSFVPQLNQEDAVELLRALTWLLLPGLKVKRPDFVLIGASHPVDVATFLPHSPDERKKKLARLKTELREHITERLAGLSIQKIGSPRPSLRDEQKVLGQLQAR